MADNEIADSALGGTYRAILASLQRVRSRIGDLEGYVQGGYGPAPIIRLLGDMDRAENVAAVFRKLAVPFVRAYTAAGKSGQAFMEIEAVFGATNPEAVAFLEQYALDLIVGIEEDARQVIREALIRGQTIGIPPRTQARVIEAAIGLTPSDAALVHRAAATAFQQMLDDGVPYAKAQAKTERLVDKLAAKKLRYRAETIARTETIRAQNAGQQELWNQYQRQGLIDRNARKVWIVTPDDRLCLRICKPLDGVSTLVTEDFDTAAGAVEYPPAHPRCRCAMGIERN